jgi:cytochrome P450
VFYDEKFDLWSVSRSADVIAALVDVGTFSSASALPVDTPPAGVRARMPEYPWARGVLVLDEPEHRPARIILRTPFTARRVETHTHAIRLRARELLTPLERDGRIEFVKEVAYPLALGVVGEILGVPEDRFELLDRGVEAAHQVSGLGITDENERLRLSLVLAELFEYMEELVEARRAHPTEDYISVMVHTRLPNGELEETSQMVKHVWALIAAGFETTANQLTLGVRSLLEHPDQWVLLLADRSLVAKAVEEMLRYRTLVKRIFRTTTRDVSISGVTIPQGANVALLTASAHRDPDAYETDPDRFDVRRRSQHVAFGKGNHLCVGAQLARLEIRIVLEELLARFPRLALVEGQEPVGLTQLRFDAIESLYLEHRPG